MCGWREGPSPPATGAGAAGCARASTLEEDQAVPQTALTDQTLVGETNAGAQFAPAVAVRLTEFQSHAIRRTATSTMIIASRNGISTSQIGSGLADTCMFCRLNRFAELSNAAITRPPVRSAICSSSVSLLWSSRVSGDALFASPPSRNPLLFAAPVYLSIAM